MRASRPILLAAGALALVAACTGDLTAPDDRPTGVLSPLFSVDTTPDPLEPSPLPDPADTTTWRGDLCTLEGAEAKDPLYCPPPPPGGTSTLPYTASTDSVISGYGCEATGGLEYECFEYDPCTGTEYVVCPDTTTPPPPPPPPPGPAPAPAPAPPATQDSVIAGYGSGSTGGIGYEDFAYDPATRAEDAASFDGKGNDGP